jgi:hypothetical protein
VPIIGIAPALTPDVIARFNLTPTEVRNYENFRQTWPQLERGFAEAMYGTPADRLVEKTGELAEALERVAVADLDEQASEAVGGMRLLVRYPQPYPEDRALAALKGLRRSLRDFELREVGRQYNREQRERELAAVEFEAGSDGLDELVEWASGLPDELYAEHG